MKDLFSFTVKSKDLSFLIRKSRTGRTEVKREGCEHQKCENNAMGNDAKPGMRRIFFYREGFKHIPVLNVLNVPVHN